MFTLQISQASNALKDAGLPPAAVDILMNMLGNCQQTLVHRGPVTFAAEFPDSVYNPGDTPVADASGGDNFPPAAATFINNTPDSVTNNYNIITNDGQVRGGYAAAFHGNIFLKGKIVSPDLTYIGRGKVVDATIGHGATGNINVWIPIDGDFGGLDVPCYNGSRPIFKDEEIAIGWDGQGEIMVLDVESHTFKGEAQGTISKGGSGSVDLTGLTDDPTITAKSYLGEVGNLDIVYVIWEAGEWHIIAAECP